MKYNPTTEGDFLAAASFNHRLVSELNPSQQQFVKAAFPCCKDDDVIQCGICNRFSKPDFYLQIGDSRKTVSLKSGSSCSVHTQHIKPFILFLRGLGVSRETQRTLLFFQYGDGTMDGKGEHRYLASELYPKMAKDIKKANEELNKREIIKASVLRFVFRGDEERKMEPADYIAYGDPTYFVFASEKELLQSVLADKYRHINLPHIGPMMIHPFLRDPNRTSPHPEKRDVVSLQWPHLLTDIQRVFSRKQYAERHRKIAQYKLINELDPKDGNDVQ